MDYRPPSFIDSLQCPWFLRGPLPFRRPHESQRHGKGPRACLTENYMSAADRARRLVDRGTLRPSDESIFAALTNARAARLQSVVENRIQRVSFCFDGVHGAHNLAAIVRSCDAWGIHVLNLISTQRLRSQSNVADALRDTDFEETSSSQGQRFHFAGDNFMKLFNRKSLKDVSKSAHKWLNIVEHQTVHDAIKTLKRDGYRICVSSLNPEARNLSEIDISTKTAFVFGNEHSGISAEMSEAADEFFTIPMYGFVESINVSVAAAVVAHHVTERARSSDPVRLGNIFFSASEQAEMYNSFLVTSPVTHRRKGRMLTSRFDVTKLGSSLERSIAKNGMFSRNGKGAAIVKDLQLSTDGGLEMSRIFLKRAKIGALGDSAVANGWERRCRSLGLGVVGFGALTCEAALTIESSMKDGLRRRLVPYFEQIVATVNSEYAVVLGMNDTALIQVNNLEAKNAMPLLRKTCWEHAWDVAACFALEHLAISEAELVDILRRATALDVAECIASSARCNEEMTNMLLNVAAEYRLTFPIIDSFLAAHDATRDLFVNMSMFCPEDERTTILTQPRLRREELDILQVVLRFGHYSDVVSSLHQCAWERETGSGAGHLLSARFALFECSLVEGIAEMKRSGYEDNMCVSRGLYEWMCVLSALKSHLHQTGRLDCPKQLNPSLLR
jgi:tRNA (guanosine-2'-O-)-methyltransferase